VIGAIIAVVVVSVPLIWFNLPAGPAPWNGPYEPATLTIGPPVGFHLANPFFAVVWTAAHRSTPTLIAQGAFFNSTPITWYRIGGQGGGYDPTTQTNYIPPLNGGGPYLAVQTQALNLTWIRSWCESRTPPCLWLGYLPGEENDTQAAIHMAQWFHSVFDFVPGYWQIDNEPDKWTHYGENRTQWSTYDNRTPSALDYATMVRNYVTAVSHLYPSDRFVGIEASCDCDKSLITDTAALAGPLVQGMAYHSYPGPPSPNSPLATFYASLSSNQNPNATAGHFRASVVAGCPSCVNLPVQIGEYQTGPPVNHSPFALQYPGAPFLAASVILALEANISMFTEFDSTWLIDSTTNAILPEGLLYQRVLANMTMGTDVLTGLNTSAVSGVYSILIHNGSRSSVLLVNTNLDDGLNLTIPALAFPAGTPGSVWHWDPSSEFPLTTSFASLPTNYLVPAQGILLVNNF